MKKVLYIFTLLFLNSNIFSQGILSYLHNYDKLDVRDNTFVKEIESQIIFYGKYDESYNINISKYNSENRLISKIGYDNNGKLINSIFIDYDASNTKIVSIKIERKNIITYKTYEYDISGFLVNISEKKANDEIMVFTEFINNNDGYPIESLTTHYNSNSYVSEVAEYDFLNNKIIITSINSNDGKSSYESKIDKLKKSPNDILNNNGDIIKMENSEFEYKYDKFNNWTEKTEYKIVNGVRQKYNSIKRKYKYSK